MKIKKPVCSICGHGDIYPWGPSCGGTHSDEYENAFVSIGGKKIPHNDAIWEVKKNRHTNTDGTEWGWIEGAPGNVCWSNNKAFNRQKAGEAVAIHNAWLKENK